MYSKNNRSNVATRRTVNGLTAVKKKSDTTTSMWPDACPKSNGGGMRASVTVWKRMANRRRRREMEARPIAEVDDWRRHCEMPADCGGSGN